jgi:hypothetical protein
MSFEFGSVSDKENFFSFKALIKNNGFFKSSKQKAFMERNLVALEKSHGGFEAQFDRMQRYFGITINKNERVDECTAYMRWADYGSRSQIPLLYFFVFDEFGIVRHYKVGGRGNLRDGWSADPKKCKLLWSRPSDAVAPVFEAAKEPTPSISVWIGEVGTKLVVQGKIKAQRSFGYNQFGESFLTTIEDMAGNIINVWKNLGGLVGDEISIKGTVKSLAEFNGVKQTVMTRVKVQ